jgi:hypothetical protein
MTGLHTRLIGLSLCIAATFFCSTPPHENPTPKLPEGNVKTQVAPLSSVINVPISMRTRVVEDMLNAQLSEQLYACDTLSLGSIKPVKIKVWKGDSLRISLSGDELAYRVPLKIWMQFSFTISAFGLSHTEYQDVEATIALKFRSRLAVQNDWKMTTTTLFDGYEWISNPVLKVRFITIPIKTVADLILAKQQKTFSDLIDKQINAVFNVKSLLLPLWSKMQDPIPLSKEPPLWLRLTPQAVYMTQLQGVEGVIKSSVGIRSIAETFIGEEPTVAKQDSLPSFTVPSGIDSSFVLNLYGEMSYDAASDMLRRFLAGRSFKSGRREVIIENVSMTGMQGYAVIGIDLAGSYHGKVYVYGKPHFDSTTATVSIEDLDFDINTKSLAPKAVGWLLHGIIISKVQPYLKFPLREKLYESQLMVQKMLCNSQLSKNVYLSGFIDTLNVGGVRLTDNAIQAIVFARGALKLSVHD